MENNTFMYQYSSKRNKEVEEIRSKYLPREEDPLDKLKKLDGRVQSAGMWQSLALGVIGALIFGVGMCFGLGVFQGGLGFAILFCILGAIVMIPAYPIYRYISRKTKKELTPEILKLSESIIQS